MRGCRSNCKYNYPKMRSVQLYNTIRAHLKYIACSQYVSLNFIVPSRVYEFMPGAAYVALFLFFYEIFVSFLFLIDNGVILIQQTYIFMFYSLFHKSLIHKKKKITRLNKNPPLGKNVSKLGNKCDQNVSRNSYHSWNKKNSQLYVLQIALKITKIYDLQFRI